MVRAIVIRIIRVTFWTSQHIFPYSICSHRGLNIRGHHCVQDVQNVQLEKNVKFTKPGKFPRHHWSHWCLQWSTLVKLRRVKRGARRYKTVLGGEIQRRCQWIENLLTGSLIFPSGVSPGGSIWNKISSETIMIVITFTMTSPSWSWSPERQLACSPPCPPRSSSHHSDCSPPSILKPSHANCWHT